MGRGLDLRPQGAVTCGCIKTTIFITKVTHFRLNQDFVMFISPIMFYWGLKCTGSSLSDTASLFFFPIKNGYFDFRFQLPVELLL